VPPEEPPRTLQLLTIVLVLGATTTTCAPTSTEPARLIVLGWDGMPVVGTLQSTRTREEPLGSGPE
jgi:hypothetical protein